MRCAVLRPFLGVAGLDSSPSHLAYG